MERQEKDEKFQWVLFSDLFLSKLKPLLISRSKAKKQKKCWCCCKKGFITANASFGKCCKIDTENLTVFCVFYLNGYSRQSRTIYYHSFPDNHIVATDKIIKQISFFIKH